MAEPPRACCKSEMQFICLGEDGKTSLQTLKLATVCTGEASLSNARGGGKEMYGQKAEFRGWLVNFVWDENQEGLWFATPWCFLYKPLIL